MTPCSGQSFYSRKVKKLNDKFERSGTLNIHRVVDGVLGGRRDEGAVAVGLRAFCYVASVITVS